MELQIRPAEPEEHATLTRLAHAAKRFWGYPAELIEIWRDDLTVTPEFIRSHAVFCATRGPSVVGFYAVARDGGIRELEHLWVDPGAMRRGVGRRLMQHAIEWLRADGCTRLQIASDPNAEGFYRRLGAHPIGTVASRPEGRGLPLLELALRRRAGAP